LGLQDESSLTLSSLQRIERLRSVRCSKVRLFESRCLKSRFVRISVVMAPDERKFSRLLKAYLIRV
jgi:hypothetical protein